MQKCLHFYEQTELEKRRSKIHHTDKSKTRYEECL